MLNSTHSKRHILNVRREEVNTTAKLVYARRVKRQERPFQHDLNLRIVESSETTTGSPLLLFVHVAKSSFTIYRLGGRLHDGARRVLFPGMKHDTAGIRPGASPKRNRKFLTVHDSHSFPRRVLEVQQRPDTGQMPNREKRPKPVGNVVVLTGG